MSIHFCLKLQTKQTNTEKVKLYLLADVKRQVGEVAMIKEKASQATTMVVQQYTHLHLFNWPPLLPISTGQFLTQ